MPTWGELLAQIANAREAPVRIYDEILQSALSELSSYLASPVILYASGFLQKEGEASISDISMSADDLTGFMEVLHGMDSRTVYLVLHSPGGSAEVAESIVKYLRAKFSRVVVIVPHQAKSAATMLACAANEILMARHSELGPIDPQFILQTPLGWRAVPAQSIRNQFLRAADEITRDQAAAAIWYPMLAQYGPALLDEAEKSIELSKELVASWLSSYMFRGRPNRRELASTVAEYLADYDAHRTHARPLAVADLRAQGLRIRLIENDQELQERVLTVFHGAMHAFANTPAVKIIQNDTNKAFVRTLGSTGSPQ